MTTPLDESPLGRATPLPERYDPSLLFPVERADARAAIGVGASLPFTGHDAWTAWELAWLDASGRPQVAVGRFEVPATSPRIVESKSVKLYLASLNHERIESREVCAATIARDLSQATGAEVRVALALPPAFGGLAREPADGASIDAAPLASIPDEPDPSRLTTTAWDGDETLHTSLFRSVCPVTGQPDYATVIVRYRGPRRCRGPSCRASSTVRRSRCRQTCWTVSSRRWARARAWSTRPRGTMHEGWPGWSMGRRWNGAGTGTIASPSIWRPTRRRPGR